MSSTVTSRGVRRLHWGCGGSPEPGWINSDAKCGPGIDISANICDGLPLENASIDYAVSVHALQEIPLGEQLPVLIELHRVLARGGVLRLVLPDLIKGFHAYERGDHAYFLVPNEEACSLGGKLVMQLLWYGYSRTLFTSDFIEELLFKAGFSRVDHCGYRQTAAPFAEITSLDNREQESLFVEATK